MKEETMKTTVESFGTMRQPPPPGHWSPFEHVAQALPDASRSGNFIGWKQYRKTFANEHVGGAMP